ncbi:MAG: calcium-binding protein [Microcystaceae cyanobacterium]
MTGDLIGNEYDLFETLPDSNLGVDVNNDGVEDIGVVLPVIHQISTPIFEGNPDGTASIRFEYNYDQILDEQGKGGNYVTELPYNINRPEEFGPYYTEGGLPIELAPSFDEILETMRSPSGFTIGHSIEPEVKPDYLLSRPNVMIGFTNFYPYVIPEGVIFEPIQGTYRFAEPTDLVTHVNEIVPARQAAIDAEKEQIVGDSGDNVFDAADPNDDFDGNQDTVFTGVGDDLVDASQATAPAFPSTLGNNRIYGGPGLDELLASRSDRIFGGNDADIIDGTLGRGRNRLYGGDGDDEILAGERDRVFGGDGDDILDSSLGNGGNRLYGQAGNDTFFAGAGDRFLGGEGDDTFIVLEGGNNIFTGGEGQDTFWITTGTLPIESNTITDFQLDIDRIGIEGLGITSVDALDFTQEGTNTIISFNGSELVTLNRVSADDLTAISGTNLVFNGDFEAGDVGFLTEYEFADFNPAVDGERQYEVGDDPQNFNPLAVSFGDHTTGDGLMLIANAAVEPDIIAWSQTIDVLAGTDYELSAFVAEWGSLASVGDFVSLSPGVLEFRINGEVVGTPITTPSIAGVFEQFSAIWNSGSSTTAKIDIVETTNIAFGNDFSVDDISFTPISSAFIFG